MEADESYESFDGKAEEFVNRHKLTPFIRFKNYKKVFEDMVKNTRLETSEPVISISIAFDASMLIVLTNKSDARFIITCYDLKEDQKICGRETFGDDDSSFVRIKQIEQYIDSTLYAVVFIEDGEFKLTTLGCESLHENCTICCKHRIKDLNLSHLLGLNDYAEPLEDNLDPFIACSFIDEHTLFVNLFHAHPSSMEHYHFFFDMRELKIKGDFVKI